MSERQITTIEELETLYGAPSGGAVAKEIDYISAGYRALIERAPFVVVATSGPEGLDCSPRGDPPSGRAQEAHTRPCDLNRGVVPTSEVGGSTPG